MSSVCTTIDIKTIEKSFTGEQTGALSFFESLNDIPFEIKRIYYITNVKKGSVRGYHAHKALKQFIFCPYGKIELCLENKYGNESIILSNNSKGVYIDCVTWRTMKWLVDNSVLIVAASDYYDEKDYIRDYKTFKKIIRSEKI